MTLNESVHSMKLGSLELSADILAKSNIGLWAIELDEGAEPRMFVDATMLSLIGLKEQTTPEKTYHAWYDNIHPDHYGEVAEAVDKMVGGAHAEVQYPWNDPEKGWLFVRCGGVRNYGYTKGVRLEGCHQDVTQLMHFQKMEEESSNGLRSFSERFIDRFVSAYYVNIADGTMIVYRRDDDLHARYDAPDEDYYTSVNRYIDEDVYPEDRDKMREAIRTDYIRSQLEKAPEYSIIIRDISNKNDMRYLRFQIIRGADADHAAFGFTDITENILEANRKKELDSRNLAVIDTMASEYSSVYYINTLTDTVTPYALNEETKAALGLSLGNEIPFRSAFAKYVELFVIEGDKTFVMNEGSLENIRTRLASQKSFTTVYRAFRNGVARYCEMKFVKMGDENAAPDNIVLAFADRDEEICARFVTEKLTAEYASIFLVNLENDTYRFVYRSAASGFADVPGGVYSDTITEYAGRVRAEFRDMWYGMANPDYLHRSYFGDEDRREFVYILDGVDLKWRRVVSKVVERKDGLPVSFIMTFTTLDYASSVKNELDAKIAEQKVELEAQQGLLEQALERAEAANRAKTTFLSNMSHDIRTPMNAIIGFTNLAMQRPEDTERVQGYLAKIAVSSQHLLSLINDILDMSRIESGKIQLEEVDCNIADIMHDLNTIILGQSQAKQQNLFMDSFDVTDENVVCDKLRLHQVLINLLSNAVKFTPPGGDIHVYVRQTSANEGFGSYDFHVKDNGIGMSAEFVEHLFEPFERERTSTVSRTQGTGLGMSITKSIVDMMGGTIDVISAPGEGTEYIIHLTMRLQEKAPKFDTIEPLLNTRALVVDDDFNACDSATKLLERLGMRAEWTMYGKEAVLRAKQAVNNSDPFSVFVIDWLMPDMNGIEVVRRIRYVVGPDKPIIIMTAYDWTNIEEEAREAGVTAFMTKPLFLSEMHDVLARAVGLIVSEAKTEAEAKKESFAGKKILLVEDNEMNREIASEILEEHGFIIDAAEDGTVAVEKMKAAAENAYDLILMDIQMPIMNGYNATKEIRKIGGWCRSIPIVAMTANAFAEDRMAALNAGMNDHIAKPIDIGCLNEVLGKVLK